MPLKVLSAQALCEMWLVEMQEQIEQMCSTCIYPNRRMKGPFSPVKTQKFSCSLAMGLMVVIPDSILREGSDAQL